jgi:hypothetical protein
MEEGKCLIRNFSLGHRLNGLCPQVTKWAEAAYKDGAVFSILPMMTATLLLFLCRLWMTSNFPSIEGACKAIKSRHKEYGYASPFVGEQEWLVKRLLRAFRKMSPKPAQKSRRPITTLILLAIARSGNVDLSIHDERCLWAALLVAVFCLLRAGEFLEQSNGKLLSHGDFKWMEGGQSQARLTLHNTKSMVWREDVFAYLFANDSIICPARAMADLLENYPAHLSKGETDPLFTLSSGKRMKRKDWVPWVQARISDIGLKGEKFNGISARKGGADSLRLVEAPNDVVRKMGRWSESSFMHETYQAVSSRELASFSKRISELSREQLIAQGKGALLDGEFDSTGIFVEAQAVPFIQNLQTSQWAIAQPVGEKKPSKSLKLVLKRI